MRDDVSSDRLCTVFSEAHPVWVSYYLVGQDHSDAKLFRHPCELPQESRRVIRPSMKKGKIVRNDGIKAAALPPSYFLETL